MQGKSFLLAWRIFRHAIMMLPDNLRAALRASWVLLLVAIAVPLVAALLDATVPKAPDAPDPASGWGFLVFGMLVGLIAYSTLAVSRFRYLLLEEGPGKVLSTARIPLFRRFFLISLLLSLYIFAGALFIGGAVFVAVLLVLSVIGKGSPLFSPDWNH